MARAELKDIVVPYNESMQEEPDLELGLLGGMKIVRTDGRFGFVQNVRTIREAQDLIEDIEEATGILLWKGHAIDIRKTLQQGRGIKKRLGVGLWQRREPEYGKVE